jgi:hypothetical protein
MNSPNREAEERDLARIAAAVKEAREAKAPSFVRIDVDGNGGVTTITLEIKKRLK